MAKGFRKRKFVSWDKLEEGEAVAVVVSRRRLFARRHQVVFRERRLNEYVFDPKMPYLPQDVTAFVQAVTMTRKRIEQLKQDSDVETTPSDLEVIIKPLLQSDMVEIGVPFVLMETLYQERHFTHEKVIRVAII